MRVHALAHGARTRLAPVVRLVGRFLQTLAEVRRHRALLEAELYRNRYRHSSKNDDDLPVVSGPSSPAS